MVGNFHMSCETHSFRVDDGHMLRGRLTNMDGDMVEAEIDLNTVLGNDNGSFKWGSTDFAGSAQDISFAWEGEQPILHASLRNMDGELIHDIVNLTERIGNNNGEFAFEQGD